MQYVFRCGILLVLLAAGCTAGMKGYADTAAPPASGIDPPGGTAAAAKAEVKKDVAEGDAKSEEKPAAAGSEKK